MEGLLKKLAERSVATDYIHHLLAAFSQSPRPPAQPLDEKLTNREFDVLELLGQRLRTKEIALRLAVSVETVNTHLRSIYRKLDVHKRQEAVAKARTQRIL